MKICSWNVTNKCNLQCKHCYRDAGKELRDELTTEEGFSLLDEISKANFKLMVFSGGEPLMRPDILELTKHASSLGLRPVYGTNGYYLDLETAKSLKLAGGAAVAISLHMIDKEKLDDFCGVQGAYDMSLNAMRNCNEVGLPFQVNTTVFDSNIEDIEKICELAKETGAKSHHVLFLVPTGRGKDIEDRSLRSVEYERLIRRLLKKRIELNFDIKPTCAPHFKRIAEHLNIPMQRYSRGCLSGISYISVIPNGDVWPCPYLPLKLGNIREKKFSEIWKNNSILNKLRTMDYTGTCGICEFKQTCGGCRARAYFYNDDIMAQEPWCMYKYKYVELNR
ncbi:MAG: radical SAM protein [Promethearchaeota archaeon]|jgi:putative heme d1 biosynthesis radical SAM protein NirJ2